MITTGDIHYNFDLSSVIRFIGGNYTNVNLKVEYMLGTLSDTECDHKLVDELKRIMTVGCPAYFNASSSNKILRHLHNMVTIPLLSKILLK